MSEILSARAIAPEFTTRAADGERLRTMPPDLVARAKQAGLFRIGVPRSLGGLECDPVTVVEVIEEISRADGSAGWTVAIGNSVAFFAWLEPLVVTEMLGGDRDIVSTGVFAPMGRAVRDGGDFVLTGRWPFNSGCMHADWFQTGFFVMDGDRPAVRPDGNLDWRFAFYRREQAEIIDTWHTLGLRGTGSHDVAVHGLRIPESHTAMPFYDPPRHESALLALGFSEFTAAILSGIPLGIARRALDELEAFAPTKRRPNRETTIAEDAHAQFQVGRAEGALLSARAFVIDSFGDAWDHVRTTGAPTPEQQGRMLLSMQQAMDASLRAVDVAYEFTGASAVFDDNPIGRCWRDLHTARQHVVFSGYRTSEYARTRFEVQSPVHSRAA